MVPTKVQNTPAQFPIKSTFCNCFHYCDLLWHQCNAVIEVLLILQLSSLRVLLLHCFVCSGFSHFLYACFDFLKVALSQQPSGLVVHPLNTNSNTAVLLLFVIVLHTAIYSAIIFVAQYIRTLHGISWIKKLIWLEISSMQLSQAHTSNNKPNSTAQSIVQGMSSSLLVVVHQYTEFTYMHTCMNNIITMHCFEEV